MWSAAQLRVFNLVQPLYSTCGCVPQIWMGYQYRTFARAIEQVVKHRAKFSFCCVRDTAPKPTHSQDKNVETQPTNISSSNYLHSCKRRKILKYSLRQADEVFGTYAPAGVEGTRSSGAETIPWLVINSFYRAGHGPFQGMGSPPRPHILHIEIDPGYDWRVERTARVRM